MSLKRSISFESHLPVLLCATNWSIIIFFFICNGNGNVIISL